MNKIYKILFFLFLIPLYSFGATSYSDPNAFITDFPIFVNGDVQSIENSFKFIKILLSDSDFVNNSVTLMAFVLTGLAGWRTFKTQALTGLVVNSTYLTVGVLSLTGSLPVSVHIEDQRTQIDYAKYGGINYAKVDGIPFPIASLISVTSTITLSIVEKVEQATVDVDSDQVSGQAIGFATAFSDVTKIINYAKYSSSVTSSIFEQDLVEYISTCILDKAYYSGTAQKDIIRKVRNPQADIFKEINASNLGIASETITFTDSAGNSYGTCGDLYNYLSTNYSTVADDTLALLDKSLTSSGVYLDMSKVTNAKITDSLISGELGQYKAYVMNVAAVKPISRAIRNSSGTTVSGQDLANSITLEATNAKVQSEGAGQFRWMAEILPMGYHFMLGIIYTCSVFVMFVAIAMGYEKGFALLSNYAQGLFSFEFIKVGLEMANNSVNQYSKFHAADVLSALGSNPASIENLPYHLEYVASMTGLAGILGVGAIFIIPTIVFTGKVAVAAGALSGLGGLYKGNAIETATKISSEQRAKEDAYNDSLKNAALNKAGYSIPANMGSGDYYGQLMKDVSDASKSLSMATMGSETIHDAGRADGLSEMSNLAAKQTVANNSTSSQHVNSGNASGAMQVGSIKGTAEYVDNNGVENLMQGTKVQSLKEKYGLDASGKTMNEEQAKRVGTSSASFQNTQDIQMVEARKNANLLNEDYMVSDLSKKSMMNRFSKESAEFAGVGKAVLSKEDLNNYETQSRGKFEETAISAKAYTDKATQNGVLTAGYKDAVYGAEGSKIGAMVATTEAMGGSARQIAFSEASAAVKATEDSSALSSKLYEAGKKVGLTKEDAENFGKDAGEAFKKTLETLGNIADAKAGAQTRSDIATIAAAGGSEGYKSTVARMSAAQMGANVDTINAADDKAHGGMGYEAFVSKSAVDKITTGMATLSGNIKGGRNNEDGSLSDKGRDTVIKMAEGKARSDIRTVEEYDKNNEKNGGYVGAQVDNASIKAGQDIGNLKAQRKESFINDDGLTQKGSESYGINATEQASALSAKYDSFYGKNAQKTSQSVVDNIRDITKRDAKLEAEVEAKKRKLNKNDTEKFVNDFVNNKLHDVDDKLTELGMLKDGVVQTGDAMIGAFAKMGAMNYASSKSLNLGGKILTMGVDSSSGEAKVFDSKSSSNVSGGNLNSRTSGDKKDEFAGYNSKSTGDNLNVDPLSQFFGNDTAGEVAKSVVVGASVLGAADFFTGGKLREGIKTANEKVKGKFDDFRHSGKENHFKGDDGKWYDLSSVKGSKEFAKDPTNLEKLSEVEKEKYYSSSPTAFDGKKNPDIAPTTAAPTSNTMYNKTAETNADVIENSLSKDNNGSITQKTETLNSKTKEKIFTALDNQSKINEQAVYDKKMSTDEFAKNEIEIDNQKKNLEKGKIHSKALSDLGIKAKDLGLDIADKGWIYIEANDKKFADMEKISSNMSNKLNEYDKSNLKSEIKDTTNGLIRDNDTIKEQLDNNQKAVENNERLKSSIEDANNFKSKFENGGSFNMKELAGTNGFKENTVIGEINQNINNLKDKINNTPEGPEHSRLQSNLEQLESVKNRLNTGENITKQELLDSTGMKNEDILNRVNNHIESSKGQIVNTMTPDRIEGLQNQMKANDVLIKESVDSIGSPKTTETPHATPASELHASELHAPKAPGFIGGLMSLVGMTVLADSALGSVTGNQDTIANNTRNGNYSTAAMKTVEGIDPWIAMASTFKEQIGIAEKNIENGNYTSAAGDIASIPIAYTKNLISQGFDTGKNLHGMLDGWQNKKSAMDNIDVNLFGNELRNDINNMSVSNNSILQTNNGNSIHLQSIGGEVNIGQNSDRMLRINGMQTQIPFEDFQQQMSTNPNLRNDFANLISGSDMNSGGSIGSTTASTEALLEQINQGFSTQETSTMHQNKNINTMVSYSAELIERTEEMNEKIEKLSKYVDSQEK